MSSSVFKVYSSSSRDGFEDNATVSGADTSGGTDFKEAVHEDLKIDSNLVILLNKNGTVSVDQNTLQSLLANETTSTSVSLVRISSPTPSIEEEIEEEQRRLKDEKSQLDADAASGSSSNEDSNEDSNSMAGASSGTSSIVGSFVSTRRTRTGSKRGSTAVVMEDDDEPRHVSLMVEGFYPPAEAQSFAAQVLSLAGYQHPLRKEAIDIEYIRHTVSNDHCYTPLTSPSQKLPSKAPIVDVDSSEESSATSTGGSALTGSTSRTSAAAKIVDRRKSVGVRSASKNTTPPATKGPPLDRRKSTAVALPSVGQDQKKSNKVTKASQQVASEDDNVDDDEDADEDEDDEPYSDYEEEESSFSEEDDDEMDLDFSVGRRSPIKKRKPLRKAKLPTKTSLRSSTTPPKKVESKDMPGDRLKEGAKSNAIKVVRNQMGTVKLSTQHQQQIVNRAGGQQVLKPFTGKKPSQKTHTMTSATGSVATPTILTSKPLSSASTTGPAKTQIKPETASTSQPKQAPAVTVVVPTVVATPKKEKKPKSNAFDAAIFSDISALFSTPDIIKKVNTSKGPTLTPPATATNNSLISSPPFKTSIEPLVMSVGPKLFSTEQHKTAPLNPGTCKTISHANSAGLTEQGLDLINTIVQEDLRQPIEAATVSGCSTTQPVEIPNIVKMLETSAAGAVSAVDSNALISPQLLTPPPAPIEVKALVEPVVGLLATDTSILEALNSGEDALPEDLMEHVAELAKNKELQEILDKQVLGVMGNDALLHGTLPLVDTAALSTLVPDQPLEPTSNFNTMELSVPQSLQLNVSVEPTVSHSMEALPTLTVKEQLAPRKEAIQIRRSDGRVITLPPIEAPATRSSKRRAQGSFGTKLHSLTTTPDNPESYLNSPDALSSPVVKSSRPLKSVGVATPLSSRPSTPGTSGAELHDESNIGELVMDETPKIKRSGKSEGDNRVRTKRTPAPSSAVAADASQDDDLDSDESWNSEDDPDRLWCICRQPHNNRFMICCDSCEDWFHGKCVNITKAMGQQMEHDGIEWTCPNCLKKKQDRQQPKMTDFLVSRAGGTSEVAPISSKPEIANPKEETAPNGCIVCGNPAKPSSIYCSDDCIRKHAGSIPTVKSDNKAKERTTSVPTTVLSTSLTESSPISANDTIIVMERKTGRCMTGKNAPTEENIKKWLQDHPTFEVVPPGSAQANIILAKAESRRLALAKEASTSKSSSPVATVASNMSKVQTQMKMNDQKKMILVTSATTSSKVSSPSGSRQAPGTSATKLPLPPKTVSTNSGAKHSNVLTTPGSVQRTSMGAAVHPKANTPTMLTTNSPAATPVSSSVGSNKQKKMPASVPSAGEHGTKHQISGGKNATANTGGENIRVTVKKTLKEHLMQRTAELAEDSPIPRLQEEEIDQFVSETEKELFILFKKDTGMKYRAKYRSLVFNIKDRKNLSLFQKISEKSIEPKQLVRMTADELASQELAQWRENETKHQLEMIKKTELESLACAKNYVLKTHKGEEMIEDKSESRVQIDPSVPVDDVVSLLNNSTVSSTSELEESLSANDTGTYRTKDYDYGPYGKHYTGLYGVATTPLISSSNVSSGGGGAKSDIAGTSAVASSSSSSVSRKKDSRRSSHGSRSRSREHKREHRDRSRDRNRSKHKRKRSRDRSSDRHTSRDRDRHHRGRERSRERSKHEKSSREKDQSRGGSSEKRRASTAVAVPGRDTEPFDSSSKIAVDVERKDGKLETHSKTLSNVKKTKDEPSNSNSENKLAEHVKLSISDNEMLTENKMPPAENLDPLPVSVGGAAKSTKMEQDQEPTSTVTIPTPPHHHPYEGESPDEGAPPTKAATVANEKVREAERSFWTGSVHMVDVASVEMSIRPVSGDIHDIAKDFSVDLDICGTIKPEIVWDYIAQIRKSPNKEVCLVRFHSLETTAYYTLYNHLHTRKRYSVVKAPSTLIKDFYIFPLPAEQTIPLILKPLRGVGIIEGDRKPNLLLGVLVKIKGGKRSAVGTVPATQVKMARRQSKHAIGNSAAGKSSSGEPSASDTVSLMQQVITKYATKPNPAMVTSASTSKESKRNDTSDEVPEMDASSSSGRGLGFATHVAGEAKKASFPTTIAAEKQCAMDVDMEIIKAPIAGKVSVSSHLSEGNSNSSLGSAASRMTSAEPMLIDEDGDEPYSPGGASDDSNFADVTAIVDNSKQGKTSTMELIQREVYELDRKIAMEQNEIEGLMTMTELQEKETLPPSLINGLPIPANLSQILASIKVGSSGGVADEEIPSSSGGLTMNEPHAASERVDLSCLANDDEEYNPSAPSLYSNYKSAYTSVNSLGDIDERIIPASLVPTIVAPTASVTAFDMMAAATTQNTTQCATELGDTVPSSVTMIRESTGTVPLVVASDMNESRLAKLSDEELLSLVPDDAMMPDSSLKE